MKRNENIVPLSKDHHFGLLCSWKVRQGLKKETEVSRIRNYILYFWKQHLKQHFREEEEILFLYLEDEYTIRIQKEHREIEDIISAMSSSENTDLISDFADLLEQHIRFEERDWFPHLEEKLDTSALEKIGSGLQEIHNKEQDDYEDEFWK
ncbi:hemerythrin-like domain-containing protein [Chryseobacterium bernardetii]|uniref:Hemerythrin HHE cation binding domain-containing protein n=3 Tax=Chryseobacterium TaxID=59732 RepID=A0A543EHA1_9FLAO|nr:MULTISPECIES: hemerythrin domain-containing protein [Chryseobacterium]MDR6370956.1 hemerythrin-like domain-containing protein [Chryseobacterium vietnamense]MDR6441298.1 hemerythrin-like domain-containing protein [Chryseobacterium bernardetii]MDR6457463.1 hemerythrin-like domain-containing protein [Chryseobacterium vietnamense]MDR6486198.1 hemerythrin-like domain-containing protein [Chryseobacterium vietnamense]TQM20947.1 hemerythrin HHE cation binding domain-containing protein [Chryseobacte